MKKFLFICLLAGSQHSFAQNLSMTDLFVLLDQPTAASVNQLLQPKGFTTTPNRKPAKDRSTLAGTPWVFTSNDHNNSFVSQVIQRYDSTGGTVQYQTTNPFFFSNLLNELPEKGFSYYRSQVVGSELQLNFTNGGYNVCTEVLTQQSGCYTITLARNTGFTPRPSGYKVKKIHKSMKKAAPFTATLATKHKTKRVAARPAVPFGN